MDEAHTTPTDGERPSIVIKTSQVPGLHGNIFTRIPVQCEYLIPLNLFLGKKN